MQQSFNRKTRKKAENSDFSIVTYSQSLNDSKHQAKNCIKKSITRVLNKTQCVIYILQIEQLNAR